MSIRALGVRVFKHGQTFVRNFCRRDYSTTNIAEKISTAVQEAVTAPGHISGGNVVNRSLVLRNVGLQVSLHARRIFINNVLNRVTSSLAVDFRRKAAKRILFGDSAPFFALVGVSLVSGTGILTKEEELEGVCWEIRDALSKFQWNVYKTPDINECEFEKETITSKDFDFDRPIAKGANAVVYAARLSNHNSDVDSDSNENSFKYPLAIKMMFNYDIQSNAMAILQAMHKETVPAQQYNKNNMSAWEIELYNRKVQLPSHPNIVKMFSVFADVVPELEGAKGLYPAALPARIYSEGIGRNMSLFLIMKRYSYSLQNYLSSTQPSLRVSSLLFTQLLEGITHMNTYNIAHRDLKSDNLLVDVLDEDAPILVISDFGCCLADKNNGLMLPYKTYEIDKGGNTALMAPEIITQTPGMFSVLNYAKSDLWAAGTIAYEIFGTSNPFYGNKNCTKLKNVDYDDEDLPKLPEEVPLIIRMLVKNILTRNPAERLEPELAANIMQLYLWAPGDWLNLNRKKVPSSAKILQWLLCLATKVLCEGPLLHTFSNSTTNKQKCKQSYPEYLLIASFLRRAKLSSIRKSLMWLYNNFSV